MAKGKLFLIYGPMCSGKSTEMIRRLAIEKQGRKRVEIFKHSTDVRYTESEIATHKNSLGVQQTVPAIMCNNLEDHRKTMEQLDVIGIDEGHFFEGSAPLILDMLKLGKTIYVSLLISTFEQKYFPKSPFFELLIYANCIPLCATCDICFSQDALLSYRKSASKEVVLVGTTADYGAACTDCIEKAVAQYVEPPKNEDSEEYHSSDSETASDSDGNFQKLMTFV